MMRIGRQLSLQGCNTVSPDHAFSLNLIISDGVGPIVLSNNGKKMYIGINPSKIFSKARLLIKQTLNPTWNTWKIDFGTGSNEPSTEVSTVPSSVPSFGPSLTLSLVPSVRPSVRSYRSILYEEEIKKTTRQDLRNLEVPVQCLKMVPALLLELLMAIQLEVRFEFIKKVD